MNVNMPSADQISSVRGEGFFLNRDTGLFSARVVTKNGVLSADQMRVLTQAAQTYGNGTLTLTIRMNIEIPSIAFDDIRSFQELIGTVGLKSGGTGARVRPIVACKGSICIYGLIDTMRLATELYERFGEGYKDVVLPHKLKSALGGCPNNCAKPDTNDLGIVGQRVHHLNIENCRGCENCGMVLACPMKAASIIEDKISIDRDLCNNCGRCVESCYFDVVEGYTDCLKVFVGGRWGKTVRRGTPLDRLYSLEEIHDVMEKAILLYKSEGLPGERFGQTCERLGMIKVNELLDGDDLLDRKDTILNDSNK